MNFGDLRPALDYITTLLKQISAHTNDSGCCEAITSAGVSIDVPAGFASVSIVQTSAGFVNITMSDATVFQLEVLGEVFTDVAGPGKKLPKYVASGSASFKWHAIK